MELIYIVCQLAAADVCEEHRTAMLGASPLACVITAPAELARIARPGWQVARWSCAGQRPEPVEAAAAPAGLDQAALTE